MDSDVREQKKAVRARMRRALAAHPEAGRAAKSDRIFGHLLALPEWASAAVVHCYLAGQREVQTAQMIRRTWDEGRRVVVPLVDPPGLSEITPQTVFAPGPFGISQPVSKRLVSPESVDFWVVPGVAFCRDGGRLGRGGGFYDRLLAQARGHTVGLAFHFQLLESLPRDRWDRPMDRIVTECGVIDCRLERLGRHAEN